MGLAILVVGLIVFLGGHAFVTCRAQRAAAIARIGEGPYKGLFSLVAAIGLILIGYGFSVYRTTGWIDVWYPPRWTHYITQLLMWPASIFVVAAYIRGDLWRALKHPMLVGVKTWAVAHLSRTAISVRSCCSARFWPGRSIDRITLKRRTDAGAPPIPADGRRRDLIAIAVGTALYLALGFIFHPLVVGVPVFGRPAY